MSGEGATRESEITVGEVRAICYRMHDADQFFSISPSVECTFHFEYGIRLRGYDLSETRLAPGETVFVRLYWQSEGPTDKDYNIFVHVLGPDGRVYGQDDTMPQGGAMPSTRWRSGETIVDDDHVTVAGDAPPGEYTITLGMYDLETMQRLAVSDETGKALADNRVLIEGCV